MNTELLAGYPTNVESARQGFSQRAAKVYRKVVLKCRGR